MIQPLERRRGNRVGHSHNNQTKFIEWFKRSSAELGQWEIVEKCDMVLARIERAEKAS